jgi:hypothetical protein
MPLTELMLPFSIERFISDAEADRIVSLIDAYKTGHTGTLAAGASGVSVHASDLLSVNELVQRYQPRGRLDVNTADLPLDVVDIVEAAFFRHIEDIRRAYPAAAWPYSMTYVEYGPTQFITPHADGTFAGFGIMLSDDVTGGEFCIETCGSNRFWVRRPNQEPILAPGPHIGSEWFRRIPRLKWTVSSRKGTAIFYGGALVHSSEPVTTGTARRVFAFIAQ